MFIFQEVHRLLFLIVTFLIAGLRSIVSWDVYKIPIPEIQRDLFGIWEGQWCIKGMVSTTHSHKTMHVFWRVKGDLNRQLQLTNTSLIAGALVCVQYGWRDKGCIWSGGHRGDDWLSDPSVKLPQQTPKSGLIRHIHAWRQLISQTWKWRTRIVCKKKEKNNLQSISMTFHISMCFCACVKVCCVCQVFMCA